MGSPWEVIEASPEAAAALSWQRWLGPAFDAVAAVALRQTEREVKRIPCAKGCACNHRVLKRGAALVGVCDCGEECEEMPLTAAAAKVWEFDLPRLGRAAAKALGCTAMVAPIGFHRTIQVTALGNPALPIVLTVQPDAENYRNAVAHLAAKLPKGFILLTPTLMTDAGALELLGKVSAGCYDLESNLKWLPSGVLTAPKSGQELFASYLPEKQAALKQSEVRRIFGVLKRLKSKRAGMKAPLYDVFMLMVVEQMKYRPAAKKCGCSLGALAARIRELEDEFGLTLKQLQAHAIPLLEMERSVKGERKRKRKPGSPSGAFADDESADDREDNAPKEEYLYEEGDNDG